MTTNKTGAHTADQSTSWYCVCGELNCDVYGETALPICAACEREATWDEIFGPLSSAVKAKEYAAATGGTP